MSTATAAPAAGAPRPAPHSWQRIWLAVLALACGATLLAGLASGAAPLCWSAALAAPGIDRMVLELRAMRVLLAAGAGAALACSGGVLQGLFRNPLASPDLIGVSAGAALAAVAMIVLGTGLAVSAVWQPYLIPLAATCGALAATLLLCLFAGARGRPDTATLLLTGIAINALAVVGIGLFQYLSDEAQLRTLVFWLMGSFGRADWPLLAPAALLMTLALALLLPLARALDLLQLGEGGARHLGVDVAALRRRAVLATALAVGAPVAISGMIGFVGLLVPHLVRMLGGVHHSYVLPAAALAGAGLCVLADLLARTLLAPAELPVGLVIGALGAPCFLWLIARVRRQVAHR